MQSATVPSVRIIRTGIPWESTARCSLLFSPLLYGLHLDCPHVPSAPVPWGWNLGESHTFQYTIDISPPPKKKKTKPARKAKPKVAKATKPKPRKPRVREPRVPTKTVEERIEAQRQRDRARNQTPERKEAERLQKQKARRERKAAGLCKTCPNPAIPGQTRCEACRDKHNQSRNPGKEGKPRAPKLTPEERIERRREYERARAETPERKEAARLRSEQRRQERVAAALG